MKKFFIIFSVSTFLFSNIFAFENNTTMVDITIPTKATSNYTKEDKLLYLNIATSIGLMVYGFEHWGYDILDTKPHAHSEGWFAKDTKHGGADKFGHAYTGYFSSHMFSYTYEAWGYTHDKSALYGMYSSLLFTTIMEVGDSFSTFGFSYEDMVSNTLGAMFGYFTYKQDVLGKVMDFRIEYSINKDTYKNDFSTDYENLKYIFAIKGSGFLIS